MINLIINFFLFKTILDNYSIIFLLDVNGISQQYKINLPPIIPYFNKKNKYITLIIVIINYIYLKSCITKDLSDYLKSEINI
jgi:hypothetical protein